MNKIIDIVQKMNNYNIMNKNNQQEFNLLRKISKKPNANQRELASDLNISLGRLNYVLKELKKKGLVKIYNFKKNPKKSGYLYLLTPKGVEEKTKVTIKIMQDKMQEYEELKKELKSFKKDVDNN